MVARPPHVPDHVAGPVPGHVQSALGRAAPPLGGDLFVCDIADALPKDDMATMEHPVFSLSTRPDRRILSYAHGGARIEITPSVKGLATIHDKDVLIYCISQLMAALNGGRAPARSLELVAHDLLLACGRETSGDAYRRLREAFERLAGTRIVTTIPTGPAEDPIETTTGFGLIEGWEIVRRTRSGRMISVTVTLSDWLYRAVLAKSVLTLSRDYFGLRKPLERRVYELARKHCGRQPRWRIGMATLHLKSGSASPLRVFRKMIRDMVAADGLPEYHLGLAGDVLEVRPRRVTLAPGEGPQLSEADREAARQAAPGWDVHSLEADWRAYWATSGRPRLRAPGRAFVAYCAKRAQ